MRPILWDPDRILNVTKGSDRDIFCLGSTRDRYDSHCRLEIQMINNLALRSGLAVMSRRLPQDISKDELRGLARWGVCHYHVGQVDEIVARWDDIIGDIKVICQLSTDDLCPTIEELCQLYKEKVEERDGQLQKLLGDIHQCRMLLQADEKWGDDLSTVLGRYIDEHLQTENDRKILRKQNATLKDVIERTNQQVERIQSETETLTTNLADVSAQLRLPLSDKQSLETENDALQLKLKSVSSELQSKSTALELAGRELSTSRQSNMQLEDELDTATKEITQLRHQLNQTDAQKSTRQRERLRRWTRGKFGCKKISEKDESL